jgi:hypothetical protein
MLCKKPRLLLIEFPFEGQCLNGSRAGDTNVPSAKNPDVMRERRFLDAKGDCSGAGTPDRSRIIKENMGLCGTERNGLVAGAPICIAG